jgi:hypothetical protein
MEVGIAKMDDQKLQQIIKETVAHAKDSLLNENSNLVTMLAHKMEGQIETSINKHVNGKIKSLDLKIDAYIADDEEWKKEITPYIKLVQDAEMVGVVSVGFLKFIGLLGVALGMIYAFFRWIK